MRLMLLLPALSLAAALRCSCQAGGGAVPAVPVAIEQRLADFLHLRVGDSVQLTWSNTPARAATIAAIYQPRADPSTIMRRDWHIRLHLADLADLVERPDRVDRMGVVLQPGVGADSAATILNRTAFGYDVIPSRALAAESSTTFLVVSRFHRAIAIISILASTVFLLCLMLLRVEERRRDVAVLRFTGISRRTVFWSLVLEATTIATLGSLAGTVLAILAGRAVNLFYQRAYQTTLIFSEVTLRTVLFAVVLSMALGIVAGSLAAWRLVRVAPLALWVRAA